MKKINQENMNPVIFTKKINDKYKSIELKKSMLVIGVNKHSPPSTREWYNSVYAYNKNTIKEIPVLDNNLKSIIISYLNLFFRENTKQSSKDTIRFKRSSLDKIHLGKVDLKHTNSKIIITLPVYNEEKRLLNFKIINLLAFNNNNNKFIKKHYPFKSFLNNRFRLYFNLIDNYIKILETEKNYNENETIEKIEAFIDYCNSINSIIRYKEEENFFDLNRFCYYYKSTLDKLYYYNNLLIFNKSKLEDNFISKLVYNIQKMYNKKIELNIVNLNTLYSDSDIFTEAIAIKLKDRNNLLLRVLGSSLHMLKLPYNNKISNYFKKVSIKDLLINKINASNYDSIKNNNLNELLFKLLPYSSLIKSKKKLFVNSINERKFFKEIEIQNYILNSLKYKDINGIRLEAHGRLTKRFTASRSIFKIKWKGTLKNVDSSIRGLSSVVLRGNFKPNLEYSLTNSKTRNGAFGLKGWISGN